MIFLKKSIKHKCFSQIKNIFFIWEIYFYQKIKYIIYLGFGICVINFIFVICELNKICINKIYLSKNKIYFIF